MPKLELPLFFTGRAHRQQIFGKLKVMECPHCGQSANLIRNGRLYGNDSAQQGTARIERGQRIRCSDRGQCRGCGCSFSIYRAQTLPRRSVGSGYLMALLTAIHEHAGCVHHAWQQGPRRFSLGTAYRLWKEFRLTQTRLRHRLCALTAPPASRHGEPRLQLIDHLLTAFGEDPIKAYHQHFQQSFLPDCRVREPAAAVM